MGIFSSLFNKNKKLQQNAQDNSSYLFETEQSDKYYELLSNRPNLVDYYGRAFDLPSYTDNFETMDGHTLREWLLLVWWGKTKNGRKSTVTIPKYFFSIYNLNAEKLTKQFKKEGYLTDIKDKTTLTDKGRVIYNKYESLWEIHSFKDYPTNLDIDFPNWNKREFEIKYYQIYITYLRDNINYCKVLVDYINKYGTPYNNRDDEINYYLNERSSDLLKLSDLKEKITILQEKIVESKSDRNQS